MEEKTFSYFRLKTEYNKEQSNGALAKTKAEELVLATSYTEAESVAHSIISTLSRTQFGSVSYEIIKTKIEDVLFNEILAQDESGFGKDFVCNYFEESDNSGVGLYVVKVMFITCDEKTGKEKQSNKDYYVPALSNADATARISSTLDKMMVDYVIRDTKFDKAEAIYWPLNIHNEKVSELNLN